MDLELQADHFIARNGQKREAETVTPKMSNISAWQCSTKIPRNNVHPSINTEYHQSVMQRQVLQSIPSNTILQYNCNRDQDNRSSDLYRGFSMIPRHRGHNGTTWRSWPIGREYRRQAPRKNSRREGGQKASTATARSNNLSRYAISVILRGRIRL